MQTVLIRPSGPHQCSADARMEVLSCIWVFIGRGEGGGGSEETKNSIINTCFLIYCSLLGDLCTETIIKEKDGQVLNKRQMRLLLKKSLRYLFANPERYIYLAELMKTEPGANSRPQSLKGHSQLMHMHIRYHFLGDLHVTRRA